MNSVSSQPVSGHAGAHRLLPAVAWVLILSLTAFFLAARVPGYLVFAAQSVGAALPSSDSGDAERPGRC